jgi:hypothetical protein
MPEDFVVKLGVKRFFLRSAGIPEPLSEIETTTLSLLT